MVMAELHTVAQIQADPALLGADLTQPGVTAAQGFFLAAEGAQLFPGSTAAQANYAAWFNTAAALNGFGDVSVQSIVTTIKPSDVGALTFNVNVAAGGTAGHVVSAEYATLNSDPGTAAFTWTRTNIVNNHSNAGDEAVASYSQGNGFGTSETWGSVSQVLQQPGGTGAIVGQEIDVQKNGSTNAAIGIDLVAGKADPAGAAPIIDTGIRVGPQNGDSAQASFGTGLLFAGTGAAYHTGAIGVPEGTMALFDTADPLSGIEFFRDSGNHVHVLTIIGGTVVQDLHA